MKWQLLASKCFKSQGAGTEQEIPKKVQSEKHHPQTSPDPYINHDDDDDDEEEEEEEDEDEDDDDDDGDDDDDDDEDKYED